jgi:TfdA family taurine catabolism dioxygenase TauD
MQHAANSLPRTPLATPDAWRGSELRNTTDWQYRLAKDEIAELLAARSNALALKGDFRDWAPTDFPLPHLAARVRGWKATIDRGRGFVLLKGFPVDAHDEQTCAEVYWGLGLHLGKAVPQNTDGDLLGHVRDTGADPHAYGVRLYKTRVEQDFHTDGADIIGLFCLKPAKSGGISRIVSSVTVFNEILNRAPGLVSTLFSPFPFDRQGQQKPGEQPWFEIPLCRYSDGRLSMFFIPWYIRESQMHPAAPRLSEAQQRAVGLIESIANEPHLYLDMNFEAGDVQLLKNATILHKRTSYQDYPQSDLKRHLLRLWLVETSFSGGNALLRKGVS